MDAPATQFCTQCHATKPLHEFRRRSRTGTRRLRQCRSCHNQAERCRRLGQKPADDGDALQHAMRAMHDYRRVGIVRDLVVDMINCFGGQKRFAYAWHKWVIAQLGSKGVTDSLFAIFNAKMLVDPKTKRSDPDDDDYDEYGGMRDKYFPDVNKMSDEELLVELEKEAVSRMRKNPTFAVTALRGLGWKVTPPPDKESP